ncbi:MAG: hypothetical protein KTR21_02650 [Rhodobacteraceae bacterium]|nr:hypothetical protein [Paracoccaceae bacterium]
MNQMVTGAINVTIALPKQLEQEIADDIEKESVFVSPYLEKIKVAADRMSAELFIRDAAKAEEVVDKATRYVEVMAKQRTGFDIKLFLQNKRQDVGPFQPDVNAELVSRGWVHDYGEGQVAYRGPVLKLAQLVNAKAVELYARAFDLVDGHFPSFVSAETLHKCGYFDSHPNQASFVATVIEDFDAIEEFRRANSCAEGAVLPPQEHMHHGGMCLNPAACFPAYPTFAGETLPEEGHVVSWQGRVFRYESRNITGLDRLYEFNVRELVFLGSEEFVANCRQRVIPVIGGLAAFFDLEMKLQTATDPFFATVSAAKKFFQASQEVKSEILIPVLKADGSVKEMACGSVNLHGAFFGERFDITAVDGAAAHTGCVGLGVERWVLAAFTQHGFDPARWPQPVREAIFA